MLPVFTNHVTLHFLHFFLEIRTCRTEPFNLRTSRKAKVVPLIILDDEPAVAFFSAPLTNGPWFDCSVTFGHYWPSISKSAPCTGSSLTQLSHSSRVHSLPLYQ